MKTIDAAVESDAPPGRAERGRPHSTVARYTKAAMHHATYQQSADRQAYHGEITGLPGLHAQAATRDACRVELRDTLETWLQLRLCQQLPIPPVDGIPLVAWMWIQQGV
jgi:predicted RNase H-like HicB family nuclease